MSTNKKTPAAAKPKKGVASRAKISPSQDAQEKPECICEEVDDVCDGCRQPEEEPRIHLDLSDREGTEGEILSPDNIMDIDARERDKKNRDTDDNPLPDDYSDLTLKQKLFCELYAKSEEFFGNGTRSYYMAYDCSWDSAKSAGPRLLTNVRILGYIDSLLDDQGLNDQFVDKRLLQIIRQDADKRTALAGIQEYNKIKKRSTSQSVDLTTNGKDINSLEKLNQGFLNAKDE